MLTSIPSETANCLDQKNFADGFPFIANVFSIDMFALRASALLLGIGIFNIYHLDLFVILFSCYLAFTIQHLAFECIWLKRKPYFEFTNLSNKSSNDTMGPSAKDADKSDPVISDGKEVKP